MSRGFGSSQGGASSDLITLDVTKAGADKRSIVVWERPNTFVSFNHLLAKSSGGSTTTRSEIIFHFFDFSSITYARCNGSGTQTASHSGGTGLSSNNAEKAWAHLAITHDQSGGALIAPLMYANGVSQSVSSTGQAVGASDDTSVFTLGNRLDGARQFDGQISGLAIWDGYILSPGEISALYRGASPLSIGRGYLAIYLLLSGSEIIPINQVTGRICTPTGTVHSAWQAEQNTHIQKQHRRFRNTWIAIVGGGGSTYTLTAVLGTFTLSGIATGLLFKRVLAAIVGAFTLAGIAASLRWNHVLSTTVGVFTLNGIAAILARGRFISVTVGTFALSGVAASFSLTHRLVTVVGTFIVSGKDAVLTYSGAAPKKISNWLTVYRRRRK